MGRQPAEEQGVTVLGAPIGTEPFVQHFLQNALANHNHKPLLDQLPHLSDLQAAWFLLLYTASPCSNYLLTLLPPTQTGAFAQNHDLAVSHCLTQLLHRDQLPVAGIARAHLPLAMGGLGLMSASHLAPPACWSNRCRLVVLGLEVGGRWNMETVEFFRLLAQHKANAVPAPLRQANVTSLVSRWSAILTHAAMHAYAASLLCLPADGAIQGDGALPPLGQLLAQPEDAPNPSRLPGR